MKKNNLEIKSKFGKWQGFLLIPNVAEEKIKIAFIFGRIDINAILWEVLKDRNLVFMNEYAGKKNFKEICCYPGDVPGQKTKKMIVGVLKRGIDPPPYPLFYGCSIRRYLFYHLSGIGLKK